MQAIDILIQALLLFAPMHLTNQSASLHATAAIQAESSTGIPSDLLLSMAYIESRYDPRALSRIEYGRRVTGLWGGSEPPAGAKPSWYCGVLQVGGHVPWQTCMEYRLDVSLSYHTAAQNLKYWLSTSKCKKRRDSLNCALQGYGGGWKAIDKNSMHYVNKVLMQRGRLNHYIRKARPVS